MSRSDAPTTICENLYSDLDNLEITFSARYFTILCQKNQFDVIKELAALKLIKNQQTCSCGSFMRLIKNKKKKCGFWWQCRGNLSCKKNRTVSAGSIFENSSLTFEKILLLMYYWAKDYSQKMIAEETEIGADTVSEWCEYFRDIIANYGMRDPEHMIGGLDERGLPIDVEIDESQFYKRKSNRGRIGEPIWVFGGIERNTRKCFLVPVQNRTRNTLMEIISRKIRPQTRIISDQWAAYRSLYQSNIYTHEEINHSVNFVDPNNPEVHTQNVECMWNHAKTKLSIQHGTQGRLFNGYLIEFMFRYSNSKEKEKMVNLFLNLLRNVIN